MVSKTPTVHSTNTPSSLVKPRTMSAINHQTARPTSPKITKRVNSSSLVKPSNFIPPKMNNITSRPAAQKLSVIKPTGSTFHSSQATKPLTINSSANRLNVTQSASKLANSRTSSSSSIIKGREPKKLVKDTINNSSFVPREKLEKLTKKHEELTNKYNQTSKVIERNQLTVDALSCLINYMAVDLDAFECSNYKKRVDHLELVEQQLNQEIYDLNAENVKVNAELEFERHRSQKEKENLLEMFEVEMKSFERTYQDNLKVEQTKREKAEKDLLYLKQNLSKDKKIDFLNKEIESLKTVLELKDVEIKDLRYKLDHTILDKEEISQLRNERDNLSLANEQLEYSLNMKNEELKFVLQENTSLASLHSLTSTPLNHQDRNNNVVKKRKQQCSAKKQKLDLNEKDSDNFLKPLNLHRDRFVKPSDVNETPSKMMTQQTAQYFDNDEEMNKSSLEDNNLTNINDLNNEIEDPSRRIDDVNNFEDAFKQIEDEINFVKPLIDKPMSLDHHDGFDNFKKATSDDLRPQEKAMDISLDGSLNKSYNNSFNHHKSLENRSIENNNNSLRRKSSIEKSFNKSTSKSIDKSSSSIAEEKNCSEQHSPIGNHHDTSPNDDVFVKPFDIDEIKERCFAKPIDKESPVKKNEEQIKNDQDKHQIKQNDRLDSQLAASSNVYQENFIKTCQILNDENEIIIKSVLDSGFCDL